MRGVEAADVERRIGLGVTEFLGVGETGREGNLFQLHPRQDVIAGAVQNAVDAANLVAGQTLA